MEYPTPASSFPQTQPGIEMENQRSSPAPTIDSSNASSTAADPMVYDVFINHRGPDTKKTFAAHLYRRLLLQGFKTFLDLQELERGLDFPSQIVGAIQAASVHVAIFSLRYTESPWCLNELLLMQESGAPIIPVFYKVNPAELRYGKALHKLEMKTTDDPQTGMTRPRYDSATIQNWRNALSSVADISGFDLEGAFNGDEIHMLDKVVECVVKRVKKTEWHVAKYPTGLDEKVKDFETAVLKQHQHCGKVQVLGIVGLGGMGKTTLALELFNRKRSNFNKSYFLADVRENARSSSLHSLQSKVMKGLTQGDLNIDNIHEGTGMLKRHLQSCHVLLILDDIDHEDQLDAFLPVKDVLRSDSLILITSRDRDVLRRSAVEESSIYKLTGLPTKHSRELFCSYAFCQAFPPQGFEDLVHKFLMTCQGLPLSLKVLGALLLGKNDNKSFWEDTLSQVQHVVPDDIQKRLKISYDALHEKEQQIFLDIVCFFIGEKRDTTVGIWDEPGWKGSLGFQNLESKCLVEVDSNNYIHMHDHLRDLGRDIAQGESPRRLWHPTENINDLLQQSSNEQVITEVRGIKTFLNGDTDIHDETLSWYQRKSRELFGNWGMRLQNNTHYQALFGNWGTRLQNNTYYQALFGNWGMRGIGAMKLRIVQTEGHLLERILTRMDSPNLVWLSWGDCPHSYLPSWIPMKNLRVLKVGGLQRLPQSFGNLTNLLDMELYSCGSLERLPESFGNLKNLRGMKLSGCGRLERLPESFGNLKNLRGMKLSGCGRLERLPESFGNLKNLQHLELYKCRILERLPESLGNLTNLHDMELSGCGSLERLPESMGNLTNLQRMWLSGCGRLVRLPESIGNLTNLQSMRLSRLESLERLPECLGNLTNLHDMALDGCGRLVRLPESIGNLTNLQSMRLCGFESLERLPKSFGNLTNLRRMKLSGCGRLKWLPESLGNLTNLHDMALDGCGRLVRLPESIGNLTNLQSIRLCGFESLERLPESFGNLTNLLDMELDSCGSLERLPESFGNLKNLRGMVLFGCGRLERLPGSFGNLKNFRYTELSGCWMLERLPESFGNLKNLQHLELSHC